MSHTGTFTYSGDPSDSTLDRVRFLLADTDGDDYLVSDEEITWALAEESSDPYSAAALCAAQIGRGFARLASKSVGDLSIQYSERARVWVEMSTELKTEANQRGAVPTPYAGGLSVAEKELDADDDDIPDNFFVRRQFDFTSDANDLAPIRTLE